MADSIRITITSAVKEDDKNLKQLHRQVYTVHSKDMSANELLNARTTDSTPPARSVEPSAAQTAEARTRSGRTVKKPNRYEPIERCTDDFGSDDYDTDEDVNT